MSNEEIKTQLDVAVERFSLLKKEITDNERFDSFYSKCAKLPIAYLKQALAMHNEEAKVLSDKIIPELMFSENRENAIKE